jgi:hypothetical protein
MSQNAMIFSGTVAPDIETVTGDVGGPVGPDAGFNINLVGDSFITTTGTPGTNTITISLNDADTNIATTIGAVTSNVVSLPLGAIPNAYTIEAKVAGFEATGPSAAIFNLICGARTTGAAATLIGLQDKYVAEDAPLAAADANFAQVGNTIVVQVLGVAGLTIHWRVTINYIGVV